MVLDHVFALMRPQVKDSADTTNFDKLWTDQPAIDTPCGTPTTKNMTAAQVCCCLLQRVFTVQTSWNSTLTRAINLYA